MVSGEAEEPETASVDIVDVVVDAEADVVGGCGGLFCLTTRCSLSFLNEFKIERLVRVNFFLM